MRLRPATDTDHARVAAVVDDWWGGQPMADMVQRLFFTHFGDTSLIAERPSDPGLEGFCVGFVSQTVPNAAYIHFVGVAPSRRRTGLARRMYERFFEVVADRGCREVTCITSPVNTTSIAYHRSLGFSVSEPVPDYDGRGRERVLFHRTL